VVSQLISSNSPGHSQPKRKVPAGHDLKPKPRSVGKNPGLCGASNVIVIPMTTLQTDEQAKYVFVLANENGKSVAKKKKCNRGSVYGEKIEIKQGLQIGDQLISEGFQGLYDGQSITTS